MQKNLNIKSALKVIIILLMIKSVLAHEKEKMSNLSHGFFKQKIDNLCSGHGLTHLKYLEIQKVANLFSENLKDVSSLQQNAKNDKYLTNLTFLIIRSDLPENKKQNLLRKSYEISVAKSLKGKEWMFTIGLLIKQTKVLNVEEITRYTQSTNEYLRYISKNPLQELKYDKLKNELDKPTNEKIPSEKPSTFNTKRAKLSEDYKTIPHQAESPDKDNSLPIGSKIIRQGGSRINKKLHSVYYCCVFKFL